MRFPKILLRLSIVLVVLVATTGGLIWLTANRSLVNVAAQTSTRQSTSTPATLDQPQLVKRYQQMITPDTLASRLNVLASDRFEGRETGTRGQKLAAQYLAAQYRKLGLVPKGNAKGAEASGYFQPFTLYRRTPKATRLEVSTNGGGVTSSSFSAESSDDLSYFLSGDLRNSSGGVVFAGYGIADDSLGYNDYAALQQKGISIDGKWVLILDDEPLAEAEASLLPTKDHKPSKWGSFLFKRGAALAAGKPLGFLVVTDTSPANKTTFAEEAAAASANARRLGGLSFSPHSPSPTAFGISAKLANKLLSGSGQTVEALKEQLNRSLKPNGFSVDNAKVSATVEVSSPVETENVLAFIEGSDPKLKDEVVVISAHYDHLGLNPNLKGDQIFNGAADDGSGVVACLALAQTFMRAKRDGLGPRRSILFANFSGEEKGILGSSFYAHKQPLISLERTVADINMDGVGGFDLKHPTQSKNYTYVVGAGNLSKQLIALNREVSKITGSTIELTEHDYFPSDQYNFQTELVPFIYYSSGLTEHYHQVSDEPQTIDYNHLARVTQLIFATSWQVANQDAKPASVDRHKLKLVGYVCPPCPYECDDVVHSEPGECSVCGMSLVPKYEGAEGN